MQLWLAVGDNVLILGSTVFFIPLLRFCIRAVVENGNDVDAGVGFRRHCAFLPSAFGTAVLENASGRKIDRDVRRFILGEEKGNWRCDTTALEDGS